MNKFFIFILVISMLTACNPKATTPDDNNEIPKPTNPDKDKENPTDKDKENPTDPDKDKENPTDKDKENPTDPDEDKENPTDPDEDKENPTDPDEDKENPTDPDEDKVLPADPRNTHYTELTSDYAQYDGDVISDVRIRGYILPPHTTIAAVKMILSMNPKIQGTDQKYLNMSVYDKFVNDFTSFWTYKHYDIDLISTAPVESYQNGAEISFNPDTYEVIIDGVRVEFEDNTIGTAKSQHILTTDKKWHLSDIDWLETLQTEPAPAVNQTYSILWMLEGYIWSNDSPKMIVRIIAQDMHEKSLYTVIP